VTDAVPETRAFLLAAVLKLRLKKILWK